ncbi:TIGR03571 family LLM class oxidoreductase [Erythrobacter sp. G21629-S1]|jgi:luciferase-type oxidoreductase|nr:TIGR03571 family LLM class oxidoreductase [Erythrobacter sp. G21629-S1]
MNALDKLASRMTFGVELPLDNDWSASGRQKAASDRRPFGVPDVSRMTERVQLAESLGFDAAWVRDVPVHDPNFGDAGSVFDPFPLLGFLAGKTSRIILGTAAIVVPLRDPIHLSKMAASVHELSNHRFVMGIASGDRPVEYPLMSIDFESRGDRLRESLSTIRHLWRGGSLQGPEGPVNVRPFVGDGPPIGMAGMGQQSLNWLAENVDGWFTYPGPPEQAQRRLDMWRTARSEAGLRDAPVLTAMHLDLQDDPDAPKEQMRLGARLGRNALIEEIRGLQAVGVTHLSFTFRESNRPVDEVMEELASEVFPRVSQPEELVG